MTNLMSFGMESKLRLPSCYVEVTNSEMEYLDGAWNWGAFFTRIAAGSCWMAGV